MSSYNSSSSSSSSSSSLSNKSFDKYENLPDAYQSDGHLSDELHQPAPKISPGLPNLDYTGNNNNVRVSDSSSDSNISADIFEGRQNKPLDYSSRQENNKGPYNSNSDSSTSSAPSSSSSLVGKDYPDAYQSDGHLSDGWYPPAPKKLNIKHGLRYQDSNKTKPDADSSPPLSPDTSENKTTRCDDKKELAEEYDPSCDLNNNSYQDKCNQFILKKEIIEEACFKEEEEEKTPNNHQMFSAYPSLSDPEFNLKLSKKKEFNENRYDGEIQNMSIEERAKLLSNADFELSPHQVFVKNFLSPDTPYNSLLLFHGLGTGKTCSAIGVSENVREYSTQLHPEIKILIVASPTVLDNFKSSLFDASKIKNENGLWTSSSCLGDKLMKEINPLNTKRLSKTHVKTEINKIIEESYEFIGYNALANKISDLMTPDEMEQMTRVDIFNVRLSEMTIKRFRDEFGGRLIIIDEVHNINLLEPITNERADRIEEDGTTHPGNENGKPLAEYLALLVRVDLKMKLLFLSATPMYDDYKDIIGILNIMNVNDKRSSITANEIFNQSGNLKPGGKELLIRKARGYISVVKGENPYTFPYRIYPKDFDISKTFSPIDGQKYPNTSWDGRAISTSEQSPITQLYLSKIGSCQKENGEKCFMCQSCVYTNLFESQEPNFNLSRELIEKLLEILIISYPMKEPSFSNFIRSFNGKDAFSRVMRYDRAGHKFHYKEKYNGFFKPTRIGQFSSKIKTILDLIEKSEGIILIYSNKIFSGLLPMALALEESGFSRFENKNLLGAVTSKKREHFKYIMITGNSILSPDNKREIHAITDVKNKDGSIIKVVLISGAGAEGIDFKFIRQVHVLEPYCFNLNRIEQLIGRAIRNLGHKDLEFSKRNVQIFMHATLLEDLEVESIDLYVYRIAEGKAKTQGIVTRLLKETAVDCILNHSQTNFSQEILNIKLDEKSTVRQVLSTGEELTNFRVGEPSYSASCDYMEKCYYDCSAGINSADKITDLDEDTYNEKFLKVNFDKIIGKIRGMMREGFFYKKQTILKTLGKYPRTQIFAALTLLVDDPKEEILDKYSRPGRLVNLGDYYLFQPSELNNPRISLFERSTPVDQKFEMLNLVMKPRITSQENKAKIKHSSL
jgi:hypothetical protein